MFEVKLQRRLIKHTCLLLSGRFWVRMSITDEDCVTLDELKQLAEQLGDPVDVMRKAFKHFDKNGDSK